MAEQKNNTDFGNDARTTSVKRISGKEFQREMAQHLFPLSCSRWLNDSYSNDTTEECWNQF